MTIPPVEEVLDQPGRRPLSRRARVAAVLGVVVLIAVATVALRLDRDARAREASAVRACVAGAPVAIDAAHAPVDAMLAYIRPTVIQVGPGETRQNLFALVALVADGRADRLDAARAACASVDVWRFHDDLRSVRDACVAVLEDQAAHLRQVAQDGRLGFGAEPPRRCPDVVVDRP